MNTRIKNIEKSINNAAASVSMEGFKITQSHKKMCRQMLVGEKTLEECLRTINSKYKR